MHEHEDYVSSSHESSHSPVKPRFAEKEYIPRTPDLIGVALEQIEANFDFSEVASEGVAIRDEEEPPQSYQALATQLDFHYSNPEYQFEGKAIVAVNTYEDGTESVFIEMDHIDPNRDINTWLGIEFYSDDTQAIRLVDKQSGERFMVTNQEESWEKIQYCAFKLKEAVLHKHDFLDE